MQASQCEVSFHAGQPVGSLIPCRPASGKSHSMQASQWEVSFHAGQLVGGLIACRSASGKPHSTQASYIVGGLIPSWHAGTAI